LLKRKKWKATKPKNPIGSGILSAAIVKNLDILFQAQENHPRIATTITGLIETQNRRLMAESLVLLECRLPGESLQDPGDQGATSLVDDIWTQLRRRLEEAFKDTENQVRILVAELVDETWAQQRRIHAMKQIIQQHGAEKENGRRQDHSSIA
jgi:hypothetical protein